MALNVRAAGRQYLVALRALIVFTAVLGVAYPLAMTGIAQLTMPGRANGSSVTDSSGTVVGSALIGQSFTDSKGNALSQWFQSRPSAAGAGYDGMASSGSNLGPNNPDLVKAITDRQAAVEKLDGADAAQIPADAVTASGSGLDPDISPAYALLQVGAVAKARGLDPATVRALVESHTAGRELGFLGEPTVDVLELNLALSRLDPAGDNG